MYKNHNHFFFSNCFYFALLPWNDQGTSELTAPRSNQLSYNRILYTVMELNHRPRRYKLRILTPELTVRILISIQSYKLNSTFATNLNNLFKIKIKKKYQYIHPCYQWYWYHASVKKRFHRIAFLFHITVNKNNYSEILHHFFPKHTIKVINMCA